VTGVGADPAQPHPAQIGPPADVAPVPLAQRRRAGGRRAVDRLGHLAELRHLQRHVVGAAEHPQQDRVRGERAHPAHRQQRRPGLLERRLAQPLLVERGHPVEHLAQPVGPLPVAGERHQVVRRQREQRRERGEGHLRHPVQLGARPQLGGDPALACEGEPLGAALGEREVCDALGQRREPHLVQPGSRFEHRGHRRIGAGQREEGGEVVVEPQPAPDGPLDPGHLTRVERAPRVHDQADPRRAVRRRPDLDHDGLVRVRARTRERLADVRVGDGLVPGARGEAGEGAN
jgi:hypothetical protein